MVADFLKPGHSNYKGLYWNVFLVWDDILKTYEPLKHIAKDNPVIIALQPKKMTC